MKTRHLVAVTVVLIFAFVLAVIIPSADLYSGTRKRVIGGDNPGGDQPSGRCQTCGVRVPGSTMEEFCGDVPCGANGMTGCTVENGRCVLSGSGCFGPCS